VDAAALHLQITAEAHVERRPQIEGRLAEMQPVTGEGREVEVLEPLPFRGSTAGGLVMQGATEHPRAEVVPVGITEEQMQMPYLINLIRWRHLMISHHRQKDELAVFLNGTQGKVMAPAIAAHQMVMKADRMAGIVQRIVKKALIKLPLIT
jgi:hypothetical protein